MYFGSKYVYDSSDDEAFEELAEEEYAAGLNVSDSDSSEDEELESASTKRKSSLFSRLLGKKESKPKWKKEAAPAVVKTSPVCGGGKQRFKKADTNVLSITFNTLTNPSDMHAGDAVRCGGEGCPAVMSHISQVTPGVSGKTWVCEFCGTVNEVDVEEGEIPRSEETTYLLEAGPATASVGASGVDESQVVFCVDTSGSMCVTTEVPGHLNIRRRASDRSVADRFMLAGDDQYLPHQKRNVTNISRLQAVQAAVDKQLVDLHKDHPSRRVALIAFNNEVRVIGDGVGENKVIAGEKLNKMEELEKIGAELELPRPVKETKQKLANKVFDLEEGGATALGPAIVLALELASHCSGSKIILCTDGIANVGLGRLDESDQTSENSFYETVGEKALEKGVSISVITIKGAEAKLVHLGRLAEKTGGQVNLVDPLTLTEEFGNVLADRIIATNVKATFILHKNLVFNDEETEDNVLVKNIGNVRMDQEITFKYGKRSSGGATKSETSADSVAGSAKADKSSSFKKEAFPGNMAASDANPSASQKLVVDGASYSSTSPGHQTASIPDELAFQLQLEYTDTDGTKALRVLTQKKTVTRDRALAERHLNVDVVGRHATRHASNLALKGEYTRSRAAAHMGHNLVSRNLMYMPEERRKFKKIFKKVDMVHQHVAGQQMDEQRRFGTTYSDDEDDAEVEVMKSRPGVRTKLRKMKSKRNEEVNDEMAAEMYNNLR